MQQVKVKVSELIEKVSKNRETHLKVCKEAEKGYREAAIKVLSEQLKLAQEGGKFNLGTIRQIDEPESHLGDYETVLRMLSMCQDEMITLTLTEFQRYVEDKWTWQGGFLSKMSAYSTSADSMWNNQND